MFRKKWLIPLTLALALGACAKPPQAEIDAARAKVAQAEKDADIVAYAPEALARAKDALSRMEKELGAKHYDAVKAAALEAGQAADQAASDARAGKERTKNQAATLIEDGKKALVRVKASAAAAAKQRLPGFDKTAIDKDIAAAEARLGEAESAFNAGDYLGARDGASAAQASLSDIERRISDAAQKAKKKK